MPIYITKNKQQSGPFEEHVVLDQLAAGLLSPDDLGIRQGEASWQRLGDMFPNVGRSASPSGAVGTDASPAASTAPAAKKGGCLRPGLIVTGLLLLLLGIGIGVGSRFIPSVSCDLAEADKERIDKLNRDIEKAKSDFKYDRIGPLTIELKEATKGYAASDRYCYDDRARDNLIGIAGGIVAFIGFLMTVIGLFVGRRK